MRLLFGALATCAAFAACTSFEDAETPAPNGLDAAVDGDVDVAASDAAEPDADATSSCVPEPNGPFDAGPENVKCGPNGEEVVLASSQDHCGFCGNRCTIRCEQGTCVAEEVATEDTFMTVSPRAFTSDHFFFGTTDGSCVNGRVLALPLAGGVAETIFAVPTCIDQLAVLNGDLYYARRASGVHRTPLAQPVSDETPLVGSSSVSSFFLTSSAMFVRFGDGSISRAKLDGKDLTVMHEDAALMFELLSGDASSGWWLTGLRDGAEGLVDQALWTRTNDGGSTTKRIDGLTGVRTMVLDETYVYLATYQGEILRVAKQGTSAPEMISKLDLPGRAPRAFEIAGDYLYVAFGNVDALSNGPFDLYRVKKCGGRGRHIGAGYMLANGLAAGGGQVYFPGDSTLGRFPTK